MPGTAWMLAMFQRLVHGIKDCCSSHPAGQSRSASTAQAPNPFCSVEFPRESHPASPIIDRHPPCQPCPALPCQCAWKRPQLIGSGVVSCKPARDTDSHQSAYSRYAARPERLVTRDCRYCQICTWVEVLCSCGAVVVQRRRCGLACAMTSWVRNGDGMFWMLSGCQTLCEGRTSAAEGTGHRDRSRGNSGAGDTGEEAGER